MINLDLNIFKKRKTYRSMHNEILNTKIDNAYFSYALLCKKI